MIAQLAQHLDLTVYVQDDPSFPDSVDNRIDDRELEFSFCNDIEIVPTLIRQESDDQPSQRIAGWDRQEWQEFTGIKDLGADLVAFKPGCGSLTLEPGMSFAPGKVMVHEENIVVRQDGAELLTRRAAPQLPVIQ